MKLFLDFFPILLFFGAFQLWGIFAATAVAMVAQVATIAWVWWRTRKIEPARRGGRERLASDRIDERRLDALPARPAAGQKAFQSLRRHGDLGCSSEG